MKCRQPEGCELSLRIRERTDIATYVLVGLVVGGILVGLLAILLWLFWSDAGVALALA